MQQKLLDILGRLQRDRLDILIDTFYQAAQYLARTGFDLPGDAELFHRQHTLTPAHGAGHLFDQLAADLRGIADRLGGDIGDQRNNRGHDLGRRRRA